MKLARKPYVLAIIGILFFVNVFPAMADSSDRNLRDFVQNNELLDFHSKWKDTVINYGLKEKMSDSRIVQLLERTKPFYALLNELELRGEPLAEGLVIAIAKRSIFFEEEKISEATVAVVKKKFLILAEKKKAREAAYKAFLEEKQLKPATIEWEMYKVFLRLGKPIEEFKKYYDSCGEF